MDKVYLQGQFFLKKGPTPVSESLVERYKKVTYLLHGKEDNIQVGQLDWSSVDKLHQLIIKDNKMFLRQRGVLGYYETDRIIEVTAEELDNNYVDFMIALKQGEYIGKYGKRTLPIKATGDKSFMYDDTLVLYQLQNHMIVYNKKIHDWDQDIVPISLIDARYIPDWTYSEEQQTLYSDPQKLYKDLYIEALKQVQKDKGKQK